VLSKAPGERAVFLLLKSQHRIVQDRVRNYFQKYLPAAHEITDRQVIETGGVFGTPKFAKLKAEMIARRLDARPKKPAEPPVEELPPPVPLSGRPPRNPGPIA
jgi:hypothetical protein